MSWTLHIFTEAALLISSSTIRGITVSFVREKEVCPFVITSSRDALSSISIRFHEADLAKGRVTYRGNSADTWTQDSNSSAASGGVARGKAL